ncbi:hypothetical protein F2P81_018172 [Scophthalmus maximus]|uniref:Uncharacterized protein n=1 Tax=Scophthalmus maximus TaxID=52904 RepID=A0A6A4S7H3_SCOMX|nr:hypothetical protein F2P81_018172 [Scophthalmus maximus]
MQTTSRHDLNHSSNLFSRIGGSSDEEADRSGATSLKGNRDVLEPDGPKEKGLWFSVIHETVSRRRRALKQRLAGISQMSRRLRSVNGHFSERQCVGNVHRKGFKNEEFRGKTAAV